MAEHAIQAPNEASAEAQEIIKELEAEGHQLDDKKSANEPEKKADEPKPEPAKEPVKEPEPKPDDPAKDHEKKTPDRAEKFVPVNKYNDERHRRQDAEAKAAVAEARAKELESQISGLSDKSKTDDMQDVKEAALRVAEKHGLDTEFATEFAEMMVGTMTKRAMVPKEIEAKLAAFEKAQTEAEATRREAEQEKGFDREFTELIKGFGADEAASYLAERKEDIKQLAFSEGNINTSLRRIALEYIHDNPPSKPGKKSAEEPYTGKKSDDQKVIDFESVTEEDFKKMTYEEIDQYEAWRAKHGKK